MALGPQTTLRSWLILVASLGLAPALYYGFLSSSWVDHIAAWTSEWTSGGLNLLASATTVSGTLLVSDSSAGDSVSFVLRLFAIFWGWGPALAGGAWAFLYWLPRMSVQPSAKAANTAQPP